MRDSRILVLKCTENGVQRSCHSWRGERNCEVWDEGYRAIAIGLMEQKSLSSDHSTVLGASHREETHPLQPLSNFGKDVQAGSQTYCRLPHT